MKNLFIFSSAVALWALILMYFAPILCLIVFTASATLALCSYSDLQRRPQVRVVKRADFAAR